MARRNKILTLFDAEAEPCLICGEPLKPGHRWVNFDNAEGQIIAPDARPAHGEHGLQGIGSGCARRLVKEGTPRTWIISGEREAKRAAGMARTSEGPRSER